ncbi:MAG: collagen-like protein [Balneolaceae bacterium]|nr:MAG: collagen-like protein [Balneolaceae bacterium]
MMLLLLLLSSGWTDGNRVAAQGSVNINVTGIPPLLPSPLVSDLVTGYETGRYTMQVLFTSPRQVPAEFRLRVQLNHNGATAVETVSDPFFLMPGTYFYNRFTDMPEIPFNVTLSNLIQRMPSSLRDAAFRGVLAEGLYQLSFELVPEQPSSGILSIPSNAFFNVQYAQPPVVFAPANQAVITVPQPVFSWTPVIVPPQFQVEYELIIAEIIGGQTPLQAIEGASFPVVQTTLTDQTLFVYTNEFLPLEPGKRYAWAVTARTAGLSFPFVNNGRSEIMVFDFMEASGEGEQLSMLTEITLEPGFARLTGFQNTRFGDDGFAYAMNGPATLELIMAGVPTEIPVQLDNLRIQKTGLNNPVLMGGRLSGSATTLVSLFEPDDPVRPDMLAWVFGSGFNLTAILLTPDRKEVAMRGDLRLTFNGISGELASVSRPVTQAEGGGHRIILNEIRVIYPGGLQQFAGEVDLFNGDLRCEGEIYDMDEESISSFVRCDETRTINLTDSSPGITLTVTNGSGDLRIGWDGELKDMEVLITGDLGLDVTGQFNCSLNATLLFRPDDVEIIQVIPNCLPGSRLNIGFGEIALHRFRLREINWSKDRGWEPETEASGDIELPLENDETLEGRPRRGLRLPPVEPVVFNRRGVRLPPIEFDEEELESAPDFGVGRFRAKPRRFRQGEKEFPWREIAGRDPGSDSEQPDEAGSWDFELDFDLDFDTERTESQAPPVPECLRNSPVRVTGARFTNSRLAASIDAVRENGPCRIPLTVLLDEETGLMLEVTELGGDVEGFMAPGGFTTRVDLRSRAELTGASMLNCGTSGVIASGQLNLNHSGVPSGRLQVHNTCNMDLNPFTARIVEGLAVLDYTQEHPLLLTTGLRVQYPTSGGSELTANGILRADLLTPEILELEIDLTGPVVWNIPDDDPVLHFELNRILLNMDGYTINGSQVLMAGNTRIDARFEDVFVRYDRQEIVSGRIHIDGDFTLMAQLGPDMHTSFSVARYGQAPDGTAAVSLHLSGPVSIDSTGLGFHGNVNAEARFEGLVFSDLEIRFRDDFRLNTHPFRVDQGQSDLLSDGKRVAWIDRDGLHPDPTYFNIIPPDRITLPVEQIAYIDLKENEEYLFNLDTTPDGSIKVETIPGRRGRLTVPVLKGSNPEPPSFPFDLTNLVIDPFSLTPISGTITVDIPDVNGINLYDLGIPLQLRRITWGEMLHNGSIVMGLFLEGFIQLFDGIMITTEPATFLVLPDGSIEAFFRLIGNDAPLSLIPEGNLGLDIGQIEGFFRMPGGNIDQATWDVNISGEFSATLPGTGSVSTAVSIRVQHSGVSVNSFFSGTLEYTEGTACTREGSSLRIDKFNSLSLSWESDEGFEIVSNTDITFCAYSVEEVYTVPLSSVVLRNNGLHIPAQEKHRNSDPPLNLPTVHSAGIHMLPVTIRMPEIQVAWAELNRADFSSFLPRFDFEVTLPGFADRSPMIAEAKLTLADAGITDGVLSGSILPYTFPGSGIPVPLADPVQNPPVLMVKTIGGGIRRVESPEGVQQKYEFTFDGQLRNLAKFNRLQTDRQFSDDDSGAPGETGSPGSPGTPGSPGSPGETGDDGSDPNRPGGRYQDCSDPEVTLTYTPPMGFEAVLSGIRPCGWLELGPVQIEVDESTFTFRYENGDQLLHLDGDVSVYLLHPELDNGFTRIAGFLGLDLMNGTIREGSLEITESFRWYLPDPQSRLFTFTVNRARLDFEGFTFQGQASLRVGDGSIPVEFEDYHYSFAQERFTRGRTRINRAFALDLELTDLQRSRLVDPDSPFTTPNSMRLSADAGMILDSEGLKLTGSSRAAFRLGDNDLPELTVDYEPEDGQPFTLRPDPGSIPPVRVVRGRADLKRGNSRVAWYDRDGFHLDDVLSLLPIPERIGLPTDQIAWLDTRVGDTDIPVEAVRTENGYIVRTKPGRQVDLFITGLDRNNPPKVAVTFEVGVDDAFNITSGEIEADLTANPIDLRPLTDLPLDLVKLRYKSKDSVYRLEADAKLKLPGHLEPVDVLVEELTFDENGFRQLTFSAGSFTDSYDPSVPSMKEVRFGSGDTEIMEIMGARIAFGQVNSVAFSGVFKSQFLKADGTSDPAPVFYSASWQAGLGTGNDRWTVALGFDETQRLPIGSGRLTIEDLAARLNNDGFSIEVTGSLFMPDLMGSNFRVRVEDLVVGTAGVSLRRSTVEGNHQFDLFEGIVEGRIRRLSAEIDNNRVLFVSADGNLRLFGHPMEYTNLRVGTNGSFSIDQADLLPGDAKIDIIENTAWFSTLQLGTSNNRISLTAGGEVRVPEPFTATSSISLGLGYSENGDFILDGAFIEVMFGNQGSEYRLGDSRNTEIPVGDIATLAVTALAVDLDVYDITQSRFMANAIVFIENDSNKQLRFGEASDIRTRSGISVQYGGAIRWHVTTVGTNLFSFDLGFFRLSINGASSYDETKFGLAINGSLGIVIGNDGDILKGDVGFNDLRIAMPDEQNLNPIKSMPVLTGALKVTLMDIFSIEMGVFETGTNTTITVTGGSGDTQTQSVQVKEFLRFYNPNQGSPALSLSLTEAFSGGIDEVLIYRDINDGILFSINNANLSLGGVGSLSLSFRLETGEDVFSLQAAGVGSLEGLGAVAAVGKFAVVNNQLSMGVFVAVQTTAAIPLIPMAPPAVGLTGIGGGLFLRPDADDINKVREAVGRISPPLGFMLERQGLPPTDSNFAVMIYAGAAIVSGGPISAFEGFLFMELTDSYVSLTASGTLVKQGESLTAGFNATLNWRTLSLEGTLAAKIDYGPVLSGDGSLGFNIRVLHESRRIIWAVNGDFNARIVGIQASGGLVVSQAGFFANLAISANFPVPLISLDGSFEGRVWAIPDSELGAYARLEISAEIPGVPVRGRGLSEGTLILKNNQLTLFMLGEVRAETPFGAVSVFAFLEFRNNQLMDAGLLFEIDENLKNLIDRARDLADEQQTMANNAVNSINTADSAFNSKLSDEILASAGRAYFSYPTVLRQALGFLHLNYESYLFTRFVTDSVPAAFRWVTQNMIRGDARPVDDRVINAENDMRNKLITANTSSSAVREMIAKNRAILIDWIVDAETQIQGILSPVTDRSATSVSDLDGFSVSASVPFTVDTNTASSASSHLTRLTLADDAFVQNNDRFMEAIDNAHQNLNKLNTILTGAGTSSIIAQGNRYSLARQAVEQYYAERVSFFNEMHRWADSQHKLILGKETDIRDGVGETRTAYQNMHVNTAQDRCMVLYDNAKFPSTTLPPNCKSDPRREFAQLLAMARKREVLRLAGENESMIRVQLRSFSSAMTNERTSGDLRDAVRFTRRFNESGMELWYEIYEKGLGSIANEAREKARLSDLERRKTIVTIEGAHREFTQSIDELYLLKALMTENLYALIDAYLEAYDRSALVGRFNAKVNSYRTLRQRLANALLPPVITSLTVNSELLRDSQVSGKSTLHRDRFINRTIIGWNATHPLPVQEYSLGIRYANTAIGTDRIFSTGNARTYLLWSHKGYTDQNQTTARNPLPFHLLLRARGEAGYTSSRRLSFEAPIEGNNNWIINAPVSRSGATLPVLTSAPGLPKVTLNGAIRSGGTTSLPVFWWHNSRQLDVTITSSDNNTGILRFEISIGSRSGMTDILPWTTITGSREAINGNTNAVKIDALIRNLNLPVGAEGVFVQFRAINGAGVASPVATSRVMVDETPATHFTVLKSTPGTTSEPAPGLSNITSHGIRLPLFEDQESGLQNLEYVISNRPINVYERFDSGKFSVASNFALIQAPVSFTDSSYVYTRARNRAGLYSDVVVIPYKTRDLTLPTNPQMIAEPAPVGLALIRTNRPLDPETGVLGLQYAIGATAIQAFRNLQDTLKIDIRESDFRNILYNGALAQRFIIPNEQLPDGQRFYLVTRSINGQMSASSPTIYGPFEITRTYPVYSDMSVRHLGNYLNIAGVISDETGLRNIHIRVTDADSRELLFDRVFYNGSPRVSFTLRNWFLINDLQHKGRVVVTITAENAIGLARTYRHEYIVNPESGTLSTAGIHH